MSSEEAQKHKIISDLFLSKKVHHQVTKICARNKIHSDTKIDEDIIQETFYYLSKTSPEKIISIFNQGEVNLLGYASLIAIRKGVLSDSKNPNYHKHSIAKHILFASNLQKCEIVSDDNNEEDDFTIPVAIDDNCTEELWLLIRQSLSKTENTFLNQLLYSTKRRGRYKNNIKNKRERLFEKN